MDLKYPLVNQPFFSKVEVRIKTDAPKNIDACIVDGVFLVHSQRFAFNLWWSSKCDCDSSCHVDFACDTFKYTSINGIYREGHGLV